MGEPGQLAVRGPRLTALLRSCAERAARHDCAIGGLLLDQPARAIMARLGCDEQTVYWLCLYGRPRPGRWGRQVAAIARDLELDPAVLSSLLREASAAAAARGGVA